MCTAYRALRVLLLSSACACVCACDGCSAARRAPISPAPRPAVATTTPGATAPVPETLAFDAGRFGLAMQAEGFTWKVLRRNVTRFDWSGRPASGDYEVLYSFWMDKIDDATAKLLPQVVASAAANLTEGEPCRPFEQPPEIVRVVGVDRIITVCFEPSTFYGKEHKQGVLHGIVHNGALTIVVVLSNDAAAIVPLPKRIGASGSSRP